KPAQLGAQVDIVGRGGRQTLGRKLRIETLDQFHAAIFGLVFGQGHGQAHVDKLLGFVLLVGDAVLQAVFAPDVMQRKMRGVVVALVVDEGFDLLVFFVRIIHADHDVVGNHLVVQLLDRGNGGAMDYFVQMGSI